MSARRALQEKSQAYDASPSSGLAAFEQRLQTFLSQEKRQVLVRSVALDVLRIARTLKFAAAIGVRAGEMSPEELGCKRLALDRALEQTECEIRELHVLLRQRSADIIGRVEQDLRAQVGQYLPEVRQHLKLFRAQHPRATGGPSALFLKTF